MDLISHTCFNWHHLKLHVLPYLTATESTVRYSGSSRGVKSVIRSEVSQKEKNKYCMLTHIWNLKKEEKGSEEPRGRTGIKTQM